MQRVLITILNTNNLCMHFTGARFALMEIKVLIYYFLSKFEFNVCERTPIPMTLSTTTLFFESKDGYWMNMKSRK